MIRASICTIGDEILIGQIIDTNSSAIAKELNASGVKVSCMVSISDSEEDIVNTLRKQLSENDLVIVTGGLGPTKDDITKKALYRLSGASGYKTDKAQLEIVNRILSARGLNDLDINLAQAEVPDTADVIPNALGTAPVMVFRFPATEFGHKATLYSLPGVPYEAIGALKDVLHDISTNNSLSNIYHKNIMTFGLAESALSKLLEDWELSLPENISLAYLPSTLSGVKLRLSIYGGDRHSQELAIERELCKVRMLLNEYLYAENEETLEECIGKILKGSGLTISCAESCTGGMISQLITSVPGSSAYFLGGITSYDNSVKINTLGVPEDIISQHGAVSSECVASMAEGVRKLTGSDYSMATSGIAGPGGGSADKPVGTVWVAVSSKHGTETFTVQYNSDRKRNIERFSAFTLNKLRIKLNNELNY